MHDLLSLAFNSNFFDENYRTNFDLTLIQHRIWLDLGFLLANV